MAEDKKKRLPRNKYSFKASATKIKQGETVKLSWFATRAAKIRFYGDDTSLPLTGSRDVFPTETKTYRMFFEFNNGYARELNVTVAVEPAPGTWHSEQPAAAPAE